MRFLGWVWLCCAAFIGCDDGEGSGGGDPLGCNSSDLVAQCPAGSNPILGVRAEEACSAAASGIALDGEGQASGQCLGTASCRALCLFALPCRCGVAEISRDGVICAACDGAASCGNGVCEGGETPANCNIDCGMACTAGERRCDGVVLEECSLQGRWDRLQCPAGEVCSAEDGPARCVRDTGVIVGDDMGVDGGPDGGMPEEGRIIPGEGGWPAPVDITRGMTPERFLSEEFRVPLTDGSAQSRPSAFAAAQLIIAGNAGGQRPRPAAQVGYRLVPGLDQIEAHSVLGRFRIDFERLIVMPEVELTADRETLCANWQACIGGAMQPCDDFLERELDTYGPARVQCIAEFLEAGGECPELLFGEICGWDPRFRYPEGVEFGGRTVRRRGDRFVGVSAERDGGLWVDVAADRVEQMAPVGEFALRNELKQIALSGDGRVAAFIGHVGTNEAVIVWNIETGERRPILPISGGAYSSVALSNDGQTLLLGINGTQDPTVDTHLSIWDVRDERRLFSIRAVGRAGFTGEPALSPDGRHLALLTGDTAEIWDLTRQERLFILQQDAESQALDAEFSPDGRFLMVHWTGALATQWDVTTGQRVGRYESVGQVRFEPEGARALGLGGEVFRGSFHILRPDAP